MRHRFLQLNLKVTVSKCWQDSGLLVRHWNRFLKLHIKGKERTWQNKIKLLKLDTSVQVQFQATLLGLLKMK